MSEPAFAPPPSPRHRSPRNLVLEPRRQLRLVGYAVLAVGSLSTAVAWQVWRAYAEASRLVALGEPGSDEAVAALLRADDRTRLLWLCGTLLALVAAVVVLTLVVTHRVAGPALALARACREVARGGLAPPRPLRRGDLLAGLAEELAGAITALRAREAAERDALLDAASTLGAAPDRARATLLRLAADKEKRLRP